MTSPPTICIWRCQASEQMADAEAASPRIREHRREAEHETDRGRHHPPVGPAALAHLPPSRRNRQDRAARSAARGRQKAQEPRHRRDQQGRPEPRLPEIDAEHPRSRCPSGADAGGATLAPRAASVTLGARHVLRRFARFRRGLGSIAPADGLGRRTGRPWLFSARCRC